MKKKCFSIAFLFVLALLAISLTACVQATVDPPAPAAPVAPGASTPAPPAGTTTPGGTVVTQGSVIFTKGDGWFETAFAEWNAVTNATAYSVYFKESSSSTYQKADEALVRPTLSGGTGVGGSYTGDRANLSDPKYYGGTPNGGTRVDIPGLKGQTNYTIKVVPVIGGAESEASASVITVTTLSYDRSGFAFHSSSPAGKTTGGYQEDGTLSSSAVVLYVSDSTKDTVQLAVTKGSTTATHTGLSAIMKARESAKSTVPLIVRILGKVSAPSGVTILLDIKANSNVTFEGIGSDAMLQGWGLNIREATNVEVRNLSFYDFPDDSVSIQTSNRNIWVHHNDFMVGKDGGGDKALGDGSCDIKADSSYITIAYNHFRGTGKSSLTGLSESVEFFVTFHHNFFDYIGSRGPRVRKGTIHVYNNYYKNVKTYGVGAAMASSIFVQNNYFENTVRPMIIASQGHDIKNLAPATGTDSGSIMSGENGGTIKQVGNYMDAYSASWFTESVDAALTATKGGATYNNFETSLNSSNYSQTLHTAEFAKEMILAFAGTMNSEASSITVPEKTPEQKVAFAKSLLSNELSGLFYTTKDETEAFVAAAITKAEVDFDEFVTATMATDIATSTITITISSGTASDTIVIRAPTTAERVAATKLKVEAAIAGITFVPGKTAMGVQAEVVSALSSVAIDVTTVISYSTASGDVVITITCDTVVDSVTIVKPTDTAYVAAAKASLQSNSAIVWNTDVATTKTAVDAAISGIVLYGAIVAVVENADNVTITITYGSASDSIVLAEPPTVLYEEDFEDGVATGFTNGGGTWAIGADGSKVYSASGSSGKLSTIVGDSSWTDYTVSVRVKVTGQGGSKKLYVLGHASADNAGWGIELNTNSTTAWKINGGKLTAGTFTAGTGCSQKTTTYANNTWYTVKLVFSGTNVTVSIDDVQQYSFTDAASVSGKVAFYSDRNAFSIDDLMVTPN